jgi:superfamily II DNA or RNA helicase
VEQFYKQRAHKQMEDLLQNHLGFPSQEFFSPPSSKLHALRECSDPESVLHGCYWMHESKFTPELQKLLEPVPVKLVGIPKPLKLWAKHPSKPLVAVPKFFGLSSCGKAAKDKRTEGTLIQFSFLEDIVLKPEQELGVSKYLKSMQDWGGGFFVADCGFGKTVTMARVIYELGRKAMVVAPNLTLLAQIKTELERFLPGSRIEILQGAVTPKKLGKLEAATLIVASLCTLAQCVYPPSFWTCVGTVLFDEAHLMCARTLSAILPHIPARYLGGFSATPSRRDNLEYVLYWLMGPTAFVYQRIPSITGKSGTVIVKKVKGPTIVTPFTFQKAGIFGQLLGLVANHADRNAMILHLAIEQCGIRHRVLLLTAFREHAQYLADQMEKAGVSTVLLLGGKKSKEVKQEYKCAVATYNLLELGYDDKTLDTLILCTPKSSIQQTVGRVEREAPGKAVPIVFDLVDSNSMLQGMWKKRRAFYKSRGFSCTE